MVKKMRKEVLSEEVLKIDEELRIKFDQHCLFYLKKEGEKLVSRCCVDASPLYVASVLKDLISQFPESYKMAKLMIKEAKKKND